MKSLCRKLVSVLLFLSSIDNMLSFLCKAPSRFISRRNAIRLLTVSESSLSKNDEVFMKLALRHAQHAFREDEVPVGAVIVDDNGNVLAASRNRVEAHHDATAHAEIVCMRQAADMQKDWRLLNCTLYSTLEPCPMCLSAMQSFRIDRLVYGAKDTRLGACGSYVNLLDSKHPFNTMQVTGGLMAEESASLLKRFFRNRRAEGKAIETERGFLLSDNEENCDEKA